MLAEGSNSPRDVTSHVAIRWGSSLLQLGNTKRNTISAAEKFRTDNAMEMYLIENAGV